MRMSVLSDIHLEHQKYSPKLKNESNSEVLIIPGDLLIAEDLKRFPLKNTREETKSHRQQNSSVYEEFLDNVSEEFEHIIYVPGNHEFYGGEYSDVLNVLSKIQNVYDNIHFLHDDWIVIDGVKFIGSTLWTDMNNKNPLTLYTADQRMNDHRCIRLKDGNKYTRMSSKKTAMIHDMSVKYISEHLKEDKPTVVVTHHAPSWQSVSPRFATSELNGAYVSDLEYMMKDHLKFWIHGHIHHMNDYLIGNTRIICNPNGYPGEGLPGTLKIIEV